MFVQLTVEGAQSVGCKVSEDTGKITAVAKDGFAKHAGLEKGDTVDAFFLLVKVVDRRF